MSDGLHLQAVCHIFAYITVNKTIMASRRQLKRDINYVIGDIFTECLIYKELVPGTNQEEADSIIADLLRIDNEFTTRISHTEPGNSKQYYRQLVKDFQASMNDVIDRLVKLKK